MTLPEQAGQTARSAIDALKGNPGLLVLVLLQMATFAALFFVNDRNNERRQERELLLLNRCLDRTDSIIKDYVP